MALTKTSIIKTRSQSHRTGTNDRTIDSAAPVAVAVAVAARTTGGRTIAGTKEPTDVAPVPVATTTDPVPVTDDLLFAGRPKTGALKDPPPVPRDRDSDADAKKPAAKPKG